MPTAENRIDTAAQDAVNRLKQNLTAVILGKDDVIETVLVALFAHGNILLEDVPGVGKTTLAKALAKSLTCDYKRIQFTPDLLPADILGGSIYKPQTGEFVFRAGPVFTNILLADEVNRASPRTQAALLEVMSEGQATIEGELRPVEPPFMVVATQNPVEYHGTYPLPEAQLDRFLLLLNIGYPPAEKEVEMVYARRTAQPLDTLEPVMTRAELLAIQHEVAQVEVEQSVADYVVAVTAATRNDARLRLGCSPRASLMLFRAAQALAFVRGRTYVIPDDVKELIPAVLGHRVVADMSVGGDSSAKATIVADIAAGIPLPA